MHVARVGQDRSAAERARPALEPALEPADHPALGQKLRRVLRDVVALAVGEPAAPDLQLDVLVGPGRTQVEVAQRRRPQPGALDPDPDGRADREPGVVGDRKREHVVEQIRPVDAAVQLDVERDAAADAEPAQAGLALPMLEQAQHRLLEQELGLERDVLVDRLDLARPLARRQPEQLDQVIGEAVGVRVRAVVDERRVHLVVPAARPRS